MAHLAGQSEEEAVTLPKRMADATETKRERTPEIRLMGARRGHTFPNYIQISVTQIPHFCTYIFSFAEVAK